MVLSVTVLSTAAGISAYTYIAAILGGTVYVTGWMFLVLLVLYGVGASLGSLAAGRLTDTVGATRTVTGAIMLLLLVLALVPFTHVLAVVAILVSVWGAAFDAATSPQQHTLVTAAPENATVAVSLNSSGIYLGQALGAAIAGLALQAGLDGRHLPFLAAALAVTALSGHVIVPDLRSFGDSDRHRVDPDAHYSAAAQARSVEALIEELGIAQPGYVLCSTAPRARSAARCASVTPVRPVMSIRS